eukprot:TRINITY_DN10280_c0_g1_i1.p1 TRINITY_DN10280_c0_g1~~TRINITY_DN10280_c0_g1_i1.p1  ORF type:complete len:345 (+),score=56.53 TRINITY_DN10280_c0_g1_i1:41-1075(+)
MVEEKSKPTTRLDYAIQQVSAANPFIGRCVPEVDMPSKPKMNPNMSVEHQLRNIQRYLVHLQYNFLPCTFFNLDKYRALFRILDTAREVVRESLPIRCLEATYVSLYFTQGMKVDRIPVTFKTLFQKQVCWHIVLAIRSGDRWGALGLSRKDDLMYKKHGFSSLSDLLKNYESAYAGHGHEVTCVKLGLPVSHSSTSQVVPCWRFISLNFRSTGCDRKELFLTVEKFCEMATRLAAEYEKHPMMCRGSERRKRKKRRKKKSDESTTVSPSRKVVVREKRTSTDSEGSVSSESEEERGGVYEEENDDSHDEDANREVIQSILANRSPFRRNQFNSPVTGVSRKVH